MPRTGAGPVAGWGGGGGGALDGWEAYDATTLTPKSPYQDVRVRNLTVTGTAVITSTTTSTGQFLGANGTKTAPSYSWTGDLDTGLYLAGANNPAISAGDTLIQGWTTSGAFVAASLALGFTGRSQFKSSADGLCELYATDGSTLANLRVGGGTAAAPGLRVGTNASADGFYGGGVSGMIVASFGTGVFAMSSGSGNINTILTSGGTHSWTNGTISGTVDTSVGRSAAGVIGLYSGTGTALGSSLALASDKFISFSSTTDPDGTPDTKLGWAGTNGLRIVNNSGVTVNLEHYIAYFANGSNNTLRGSIYFSNTNVCQIATSATSGPAALLSSVLVEANTAGSGSPNILTALESKTLLTNEGASAENYHTLPTAAAGLEFRFFVQDTDGIRVTANTGDTIRVAAGVSGAAGFVRCATQGAVLCLVAVNATEWVAMYQTGTWTVDA